MAAYSNIYGIVLLIIISCVECHQPNIVFIVADDLGKKFYNGDKLSMQSRGARRWQNIQIFMELFC